MSRSGSCQKQAVSTKAEAGKTVPDRDDDDEKVLLCLFRNSKSDSIRYAFLENGSLTGNDDIADGGIMWLRRLDAMVVAVLNCMEQRERNGEKKQKAYDDSSTIQMSELEN